MQPKITTTQSVYVSLKCATQTYNVRKRGRNALRAQAVTYTSALSPAQSITSFQREELLEKPSTVCSKSCADTIGLAGHLKSQNEMRLDLQYEIVRQVILQM